MCSSDGTLRKNADMWRKWTPYLAVGLHGLQFHCARRAAELLKVGGRLVYSTCSLNPLEDEAVVARLLRETQHALRLVDCAALLPGLRRTDGLHSWEPMDMNVGGSSNITNLQGTFYSTVSDVPLRHKEKLQAHLFPPGADEASEMHLERWWGFERVE